MTLLEVEELTQYWINHPPLHLMVAAYLGISNANTKRTRPRGGPSISPNDNSFDIGTALAELRPSFSKRNVHAGLAAVVLDFAELKRRARGLAEI